MLAGPPKISPLGASRAAGLAFACMLIVVAASAYIRLSNAFPSAMDAIALARGSHRVAASLAGIAVLWLAWLAFRRRAPRGPAYLALGVTVFLALLGAAAGTTPSSAAALGNLLGGLVLATLLAWIAQSHTRDRLAASPAAMSIALALAGAQAALGAWLGTRPEPVAAALFIAHVLLGAAVVLLAGWLGVRLAAARPGEGFALLAAAAIVPLAGAVSAFAEPPAEIALVHPVAAALLLAMLARVHARRPTGGAA